jgi:nucleotide-binding universal stress UspA family protein
MRQPGFLEMSTRAILHPTDFSSTSALAFAHALRIAVDNRAGLSILNVQPDDGDEAAPWDKYPSVRDMLRRWGYLDPRASRSDVRRKLGVRVDKAVGYDKDVVRAIMGFMATNRVDLIVLATDRGEGVPWWLRRSVAVPVSQQAKLPTLFVPAGARGCVAPDDGHVTLDRVLIPVDHRPRPDAALEQADAIIEKFGSTGPNVTMLHVGPEEEFDEMLTALANRHAWHRLSRRGTPADVIVKTANEVMANLIIMVTEGRQGFLDALRGSTTEQVLRRSPCPVLALPAK